MSKLTRSNVAHDLTISPHETNITYPNGVITYVFSSDLYRQKFTERIHENRAKINASLSNRFKFSIENDVLCDLNLYMAIEKRGFLLYKDGRRFVCLDEIKLNGLTLM